ncbi:MAG: cell envelope biogenesis protein TolA [Allosphingosinicella sp.]
MDRTEAAGFAGAVVGHAMLLALFVFGVFKFTSTPVPTDAIEVSFVDETALVSTAPQPTPEPPAPAMAPEAGPTEDAATAAPAQPAPPDLRPTPPQPPLASTPRQRPEPPRQRPTREMPRPTRAQPKQTAPSESGTGQRTRRSLIGDDILKGIGRDPTPSRSQSPPAAAMSARAAADIGAVISRQIQPCADRQIYPGPGAERIVTQINLRLNRDGSLAARPRMTGQSGIDMENQRYAERVRDIAIAAFVGCAPMRGLPTELYDVPRGWRNFTMNYRLPG